MADVQSASAEPHRITLGAIASYVLGGVALLFGLFYLSEALLSAVLFGLAGALVFPPIRRWWQGRLGVALGRWVLVIAFLALWLLGAAILP